MGSEGISLEMPLFSKTLSQAMALRFILMIMLLSSQMAFTYSFRTWRDIDIEIEDDSRRKNFASFEVDPLYYQPQTRDETTKAPSVIPTESPSESPSEKPSVKISAEPTANPARHPTSSPTLEPNETPSSSPTSAPTTYKITPIPTEKPTRGPTRAPSHEPTHAPTLHPTKVPTTSPTIRSPSSSPTIYRTKMPTTAPSTIPTKNPSTHPSQNPTESPTATSSQNPTASPTVWFENIVGRGGCPEGNYPYYIILEDVWGDGWDGTQIAIAERNVVGWIFKDSLEDGYEKVETVCLDPEKCYRVITTGGAWSTEVRWDVRPVVLGSGEKGISIAKGGGDNDCIFSIPAETQACATTCLNR